MQLHELVAEFRRNRQSLRSRSFHFLPRLWMISSPSSIHIRSSSPSNLVVFSPLRFCSINEPRESGMVPLTVPDPRSSPAFTGHLLQFDGPAFVKTTTKSRQKHLPWKWRQPFQSSHSRTEPRDRAHSKVFRCFRVVKTFAVLRSLESGALYDVITME